MTRKKTNNFSYLIIGSLVFTLEVLVIIVTIFSVKHPNIDIPEFKVIFTIFSNVITGAVTWFFTKKYFFEKQNKNDESDDINIENHDD